MPQSVGLLWTSDQLVAETSTRQHATLNNWQTSMPAVGFEPTVSACEQLQTYVLCHTTTGTGIQYDYTVWQYRKLSILKPCADMWHRLLSYYVFKVCCTHIQEVNLSVKISAFLSRTAQTNTYGQRLRWSRGSVLAFGTQVRGFAPDRSRRIFRAKKILSTPFFGGDVKPSAPCCSFTACKRSLITCKSAFRQNFRTFLAHSSTFCRWVLSRGWHAWRRLVPKVGTSNQDRTVSLKGYSA